MAALIGIIIAAVLSVVLFRYGAENVHNGRGTFSLFCGLMGTVCTLMASLAYVVLLFCWNAAEHKAELLNRQFGTEYTTEDVFWAGDVIDTVRELKRQRIEINGGLTKD